MSVIKIEPHRQQNGTDILKVFCKPTSKFPEGRNYFYTPSEAIDLVQSHAWFLCKSGNGVYVTATNSFQDRLCLHRELYYFYKNQYADYIDHRDNIETDNINQNLNAVSQQQNILNHFTRGYAIYRRNSKVAFQPQIRFSGIDYRPYSCTPTEVEACHLTNLVEQDWLKEKMGSEWYMFDFTKYRRGSEDILDLERTGIISEEEATRRHLLKYADNAWYVYRYNLFELFKYFGIPIPQYTLDTQGFMCHPITGQRLCPFPFQR